MSEEKKYFHELSDEEIKELLENKVTWEYVMKNFKQPDWCGYTNALEGAMGCWSLIDYFGRRKEISREFCKDCPCFEKSC